MFIIGLIMTIWGGIISIKGIKTLMLLESNNAYRLAGGITEEQLAMSSIIWFIVAVIGIVLIIFSVIKRRNKAALDSLENSAQNTYCSDCRLNVTSKEGKCPICGKQL